MHAIGFCSNRKWLENSCQAGTALTEEDPHGAEAAEEYKAVVIRFDGDWYRTIDDFFEKAQIGEELLTSFYEELYDFEVAKDEKWREK